MQRVLNIICRCTGYSSVQILKNVSCGLLLHFWTFLIRLAPYARFLLIRITFGGHGKNSLFSSLWQITGRFMHHVAELGFQCYAAVPEQRAGSCQLTWQRLTQI